jgi:predicted ATPase
LTHDAACWYCDLDRIHAKGYTDNVVDLMTGKLIRVPAQTQTALQQLACLGNFAEITTLSIVLGTTEEQVHPALWPALRQELIERLPDAYRFVHDRVQEAAYSLIPADLRAAAHLRIGRLLVAHTPREGRQEAIFEIVNQLNRAISLINSSEERAQLAELNLTAGKRAKASTAYASALKYLIAGAALLGDDCWEQQRDVMFALELERAECEFLTGEPGRASIRSIWSAFSRHSTPRSPAEQGWGCRSAGRSSMPMAVGFGRRQTNLGEPYFSSPCPERSS